MIKLSKTPVIGGSMQTLLKKPVTPQALLATEALRFVSGGAYGNGTPKSNSGPAPYPGSRSYKR